MATWNRDKTRHIIDITDYPRHKPESSDTDELNFQPVTRGKIKRRNLDSPEPPEKRRKTESVHPRHNPRNNLFLSPSTDTRLPSTCLNRTGEPVRVTVLQNNGNVQTLRELMICKELLQECLPMMPLSHILKLIMDPRQFTIAFWSGDEEDSLMAAVSARPFVDQCFIEVAFLGVKIGSQYQGYGTLIMNYLKEYIKRVLKCYYILTYADSAAVGFFEKQGFSNKVTLEKRAWQPCVKTYRDAKFMECYIIPEINYLNTKAILQKRRNEIMQAIHSKTNILKEYPGLRTQKAGGRTKVLRKILGLSQDEVQQARNERRTVSPKLLREHAKMAAIVEHLMKKSFSEPFKHPVELEQAPDYYKVITRPMDLSKMLEKINSHIYPSEQKFKADFQLIVKNCHTFNGDQPDNHWVALVSELNECFREQHKIHFPPVPKEKTQAYTCRKLNRNTIGTNGGIRNINGYRSLPHEKLPSSYYAHHSGTFTRM